jgi:hypothetical protein
MTYRSFRSSLLLTKTLTKRPRNYCSKRSPPSTRTAGFFLVAFDRATAGR